MTIVRGTIPAELYGREAYGAVSGAMGAPVMIAIAAGPFVASLLYTAIGSYMGMLLVLIAVGVVGSIMFNYASPGSR